MTGGSSNARSDDSNKLLPDSLALVALEEGPLSPAIPPKLKDGVRGFHHPTLAWLLCPVEYREEFSANPEEYIIQSYLYST